VPAGYWQYPDGASRILAVSCQCQQDTGSILLVLAGYWQYPVGAGRILAVSCWCRQDTTGYWQYHAGTNVSYLII